MFAGYADGSIRVWDEATKNCSLHIGSSNKKKTKAPIWALQLYDEYTLVAGDGSGVLSFWSLRSGTLDASFTNLSAEVLCIETNPKYKAVYASGVDSQVMSVQLVKGNWVFTSIYRGQSHDINALVLLSPNELLSAGITTDVCVYKLYDGKFRD